MIRAGIKHTKNNFSRLLARVKAGEEVLITDRGRPVARIVKENQDEESIYETLQLLVQRGPITLPSRSIVKDPVPVAKAPGRPASRMVIEGRR